LPEKRILDELGSAANIGKIDRYVRKIPFMVSALRLV
jgi:hypothetical protein